MLSAFPSSAFHTKFSIRTKKANKYSILFVTELGLLVLESSGYSYDSIWDRFDWEPTVITTALCATANGESP